MQSKFRFIRTFNASHFPRSWANLENGAIRVGLNLAHIVAFIPVVYKSWNQMELCSFFASPLLDLWNNSKDRAALHSWVQSPFQQPRAKLHLCSLATPYSRVINLENCVKCQCFMNCKTRAPKASWEWGAAELRKNLQWLALKLLQPPLCWMPLSHFTNRWQRPSESQTRQLLITETQHYAVEQNEMYRMIICTSSPICTLNTTSTKSSLPTQHFIRSITLIN